MNNKAVALIPARYASVRLPAKPLLPLGNIPLICRVYRSVRETNLFSQVIVATDSKQILQAVESYGGKAVITSADVASGTDRIVSIANNIDSDIIVNVQGDEPFIGKDELSKLIAAFQDEQVEIASLMNDECTEEQLDNPNIVKVVVSQNNNALYFSRARIPYDRDNSGKADFIRHIGVYAFRKETLLKFPSLEQSQLEQTEKLEQLRWLENDYRIRMVLTSYQGFGIDTKEDLVKAEKYLMRSE